MFGLNSPMKVLLCLLEEKYMIQLFALQLCEFEQHECLIVIRMGIWDRINLWLGLLRYYIDMTELREVTSYPVLNCLLQFWDQELSIHNIKSPCQTNHQPDLMGERAAFLDIPSIPAVSWVCSSRLLQKIIWRVLILTFTLHSPFLPWKYLWALEIPGIRPRNETGSGKII